MTRCLTCAWRPIGGGAAKQATITRMGSPLTFWKLQQAPVLWMLERLGRRELIDDPIGHQQELLPLVRAGSLWIWLAASRALCPPGAAGCMAQGNGTGGLALCAQPQPDRPRRAARTMELPLVASSTAMLFLFWTYLETGRRRWFWASAALGGLAFSASLPRSSFLHSRGDLVAYGCAGMAGEGCSRLRRRSPWEWPATCWCCCWRIWRSPDSPC